MSDPEGSRVTHCGKMDSARISPGPSALQRASSVPEGQRPELIIAPEPTSRTMDRVWPGRARKDPLLEPEMVAARVRTETLQELGRRLRPLSEELESHLTRAREHLRALGARPTPAGLARKALLADLEKALDELGNAGQDLFYHSAKAAVGMAETHLPTLIRDAVKRAFPGTLGVGFRLPDLRGKESVAAHAQHLLEALTLAVGMVLTRIAGRGELCVTLARGTFFQEVVVAGVPAKGTCQGDLPRPEDAARLRHLVGSVHQGTVCSSLGENGEVLIVLALPLRRMEVEARP